MDVYNRQGKSGSEHLLDQFLLADSAGILFSANLINAPNRKKNYR
jgi:hypothetical protein